MTPLAHQIVKQTWFPLKQRNIDDPAEITKQMSDIHCFEVTDVFELADELGQKWHDSSIGRDGRYLDCAIDPTFAFLPAPKTWIEWVSGHGCRDGVLIQDCGDFALCTIAISRDEGRILRSVDTLSLLLKINEDHPKFQIGTWPNSIIPRAQQITLIHRVYAFLAIINSPKVIGRRQHMPHAGLERRLVKSMGMVGKFPLHAWTEIKLEVGETFDLSDEEPREAHLTGKRALHFCRQHLRIRCGRLERVRAHWRGDPALGVKQSRYKIVMG